MNNIKQIRELYGATQEQIAQALNVNRVTIANWATGTSVASHANREKLSIYFGIGPEFFYDKKLDNTAKEMIISTANKAKQIVRESEGKRNKEDDFNKMFNSITFAEAMSRYMMSMKILLSVSDNGEIDMLETAVQINKKMGTRLETILDLRKKELDAGEPSIEELMEEFSDK